MRCKPHAFGCQPVDIGRFNLLLSVTARFAIPEVVGKYQNYIRTESAVALHHGSRGTGMKHGQANARDQKKLIFFHRDVSDV